MECDILMFLHGNPECNTAASLVRICKYTKSHVSTSLKRLEQRGLVERQQSATNKKHIELHLTATQAYVIIRRQPSDINAIFFNCPPPYTNSCRYV